MEPSVITIPVDREIKFKKADLEALKDSQNGYKNSQWYRVCSISNVQYYIKIAPNGTSIPGTTCMFLELNNGNAIAADGEITLFVESAKYQAKWINGKGPSFCSTSKFFDSKFFVNDILTVKVKGTFSITLPARIRYPFSGQWKIKEADLEALRTSTTNGNLMSKRFSISSDSDIKYYLKLYPNGNKDEYRGKTWIFLHLHFGNASKVEAVYNISVPSADYMCNKMCTYDKSKGYGNKLCSTKDLFNPDNRYFVDGELVIKVSGTLLIEKEKTEPTTLSCENGIASKAYQRHRGKEFTIVAGEKKIKVHKKVLIEASPVLEAMFRSGMKEVTEKKMELTDFTPDIVEAAVKLLYSDSIPTDFTFEQVLSLLQFADKYDIKLIMNLIQDYLIEKLSPSNVCFLINYTTTTTVSATQLHSKCLEYLIKCSEEKKAVHGIDTLDKDIILKLFLETLSQNL